MSCHTGITPVDTSYGNSSRRKSPEGSGFPKVWLDWVLTLESDDCYIWPFGNAGQHGYGSVRIDGKVWRPAQYVCTKAHGPKPGGPREYDAAHACFRRLCCNKNHVRWLTHRDNCREGRS